MLVEAAADHDADPLEPGGIQLASRLTGQLAEVTGVDPHGAHVQPFVAHQSDHPVDAAQGVVGVHQQGGTGVVAGVAAQRLGFVIVGLDVGVRHGAAHRQVEAQAAQHVAGAGNARHPVGAHAAPGRFQPVHAAHAEIHHRHAVGGQHHARRLGGEQRFQVDVVHQQAFQQLPLDHRRPHFQQRLVGEHHRALRQRPDFPLEAEIGQPAQEGVLEQIQLPQPLELFGVETQPANQVGGVLLPAGHRETAPRRQLAEEQTEHRLAAVVVAPVGLRHGQFVEVREQGQFPLRRPESVH